MKTIFLSEAGRHENQPPITLFLAVCSKQIRTKKDGTPFLALKLSDRTGQCEAVMWENFEPALEQFDTGDVVKVRARVGRYGSKLQLVVELLRRANADEFELSDYTPH
ncbi:MAG: OB-fold nucleic acid binding domain-containing protein, partial [Acidobacteriaceae bacterium]